MTIKRRAARNAMTIRKATMKLIIEPTLVLGFIIVLPGGVLTPASKTSAKTGEIGAKEAYVNRIEAADKIFLINFIQACFKTFVKDLVLGTQTKLLKQMQ